MSIPNYALEAIKSGKEIENYFCTNCKKQRWFEISKEDKKCLKCESNDWIKVERTLTRQQKDIIREECGGKCANPGCSNRRTDIHHIDEWAIYHSDNPNILIPVCPACHDQIHNGVIDISRERQLEWKSIKRPKTIQNLHIYIEPGKNIKFLLGNLWIFNSLENWKFQIFKISDEVSFKIDIRDNKLSLIDLSISNLEGQNTIRVLSNYIEVLDPNLDILERTGLIRISTKNYENYVPKEFLLLYKTRYSDFNSEDLTLLELEVLEPGVIGIKGFWYSQNKGIVMDKNALTFLPSMTAFVSKDPESGLKYSGEKSLFNFGKNNNA